MRVFLTGATGFVGSYILKELVRQGYQVRCLLRNVDIELKASGPDVDRVEGDVSDAASINGTMRGCDAVIHLVGILEEQPRRGITFEAVHDRGTLNVVQEAAAEGIDTFIHMSANGASADSRSSYQRTKWAAEQHVQNASFKHWTIFRPSIVFGDAGVDKTEFSTRLLRQLIRPFPVLPIFGDGSYGIQPIFVEDMASAFVQAITLPAAAGKIYCATGKDTFSYRDALDIIAEGAGLKPRPKVPQPMWLVRPVVRVAGGAGLLPISPEQFEMLVQGNTCDATQFQEDFELRNVPYNSENLTYLRRK